jgi:hypothetical protein
MDATEALAIFERRLEKAQAVAWGNSVPWPPPKGATLDRWSQEMMIAAVCELMENTGLQRFLPLPHFLMESLGNLDRGLTPNLLRPAARREQRILIDDARTLARAVKAVDMLTARNHSRRISVKAAARLVYKTMAWSGLAKSASAIIELRKNVRRGRANLDVIRICSTPFPPEAGETADERANWLLTTLTRGWSIRG